MTSPDMPGHRKTVPVLNRSSDRSLWRIGVAAVAALGVLSGCSQGRGDWPTLASALGWGGDRVPPPDVEVVTPTVAPVRAAAARGAPDLTAWAAPPPIPVAPVASAPYSYGNGGDLVAEAFAQGLAATAPTISTAPAGPTFANPGAPALPLELPGIVPRVVLDTYNDALSQSVASPPDALAASVGDEATVSGVEYLDPVVIKFRRGSSHLSPRDKKRLGRVAKDYRSQGGIVYVIGHASSRTGNMDKARHDLVNFEVSVDRANAVTGELLRQGVSPEHMMMEARADRDPIYYEYMPSGEVGNQRVEIFLE